MDRSEARHEAAAQADPTGVAAIDALYGTWRATILAASLIVLSAAAVYSNSFVGVFVYDDVPAIEENPTIRHLWPISPVLNPPKNGETVSGRPLLNLSLAINYAISGLNVWSYHAANLLIHIAAALLLFGIVRRTLLTPLLRNRFGRAATPLALACALIWAVHPLQTESVTYIVQRAESLMGFFYLLTLYCVIRGADLGAGTVPFFAPGSPLSFWERVRVRVQVWRPQAMSRLSAPAPLTPTLSQREREMSGDCPPRRCSWLWYAAAVLACLLGMATKEVMVTAPLVVLLYDRTFLSGSFAEALRRRWGLYVGLAATWGLLAYLVFSTGLITRQPEFGSPDWWSYARSEPGVILYYLRMSVWPTSLCFYCDLPVASTFGEIVPAAIAVPLLVAATVYGLMRRRVWGFLSAWFFVILLPTSSIQPLQDLAYVHRMYLSLAALVVAVVVGGYHLWQKWPAASAASSRRAAVIRRLGPLALLAAVLAVLGYLTITRNWDYRSLIAIWQDAVDKRPNNPAAHNNLGYALVQAANSDEAIQQAIEHYHEALRLKPDYPHAHNNLGTALALLGKPDQAIEHFQEALRLRADFAMAYCNLGWALAGLGRQDQAIPQYQAALRIKPEYADAHYNLGAALAAAGSVEEAIRHYHEALRLKPEYVKVHNDLGVALSGLGKTNEALEHFREALRLKSDYAEAQNNLGMVLAGLGQTDEAVQHYRQALERKPDFAEAHYNLGNLLTTTGKIDEAIEHYREAVRLKSDYAEAHNNLGAALLRAGKIDEALEHYREAVRLKGDYAEAHHNLGIALTAANDTGQAIEQFRQALRCKPDYTDAHYNLANLLLGSGKVDEAIEQYHQVLRAKPDHFEARNNLGAALDQMGKTNEAIEQYHEALRIKPDYAQAHYNLAIALAAAGNIGQSIEHYHQTLRLKPDYAEARLNLANALFGVGKIDEAFAHYGEVLRLKPDYPEAHFNLALALAAAGRTHEAIEHFNRLLQLTPNSAAGLHELAWLLATHEPAEGGDPARAMTLAQQAQQLAGQENAPLLDMLAAAYAAAGRFGEAVNTAERAVQLAESAGQTALAKNVQSRLELYRAGRPYRAAPRSSERIP